MALKKRSEFSGKPSRSGVGVNPMVGRISGCRLTASDQLGLTYRTGHPDTDREPKRNAWLGWEDVIPPPRPSRIPPE